MKKRRKKENDFDRILIVTLGQEATRKNQGPKN